MKFITSSRGDAGLVDRSIRPLFSSKRRPHFKTLSGLGTNRTMVMGHDGASTSRMTVLAQTINKLLFCSAGDLSWSFPTKKLFK
jgi:hypothetical protein